MIRAFAADVERSRFFQADVVACVVSITTALIQIVTGHAPADPLLMGFVAGLGFWMGRTDTMNGAGTSSESNSIADPARPLASPKSGGSVDSRRD